MQSGQKRDAGGNTRNSGTGTQTERNPDTGETDVDDIAYGFKVYRGPPAYTHVVLPFVYEEEVEHQSFFAYDYAFRMTSPYDPYINSDTVDLNPGAGTANVRGIFNESIDTRNKSGHNVAFWEYYKGLYKYYNVLACRYKVTFENRSHDTVFVHQMYMNDSQPPTNASNTDMMIWQDVKTQIVHSQFTYANTLGYTNANEVLDANYDDDAAMDIALNSASASGYIQNKNGTPICVFAGEYRSGQHQHEIHQDEDVQNWTAVSANPKLREALLIRIKPRDNATPPAGGNASDQQRRLTFNIRVEIEYLTEFKELDQRIRYPVNRNPVTILVNSTATDVL